MSSTKERPRSTCRGGVYPRTNQSAGCQARSNNTSIWHASEMRGDCDYDTQNSDLQYGPGIVDRLKSRFIHLTIQSNDDKPRLKRSCSLEHLVEDGVFQAIDCSKGDRSIVGRNRAKYDLSPCGRNNFKKAPSMETLVFKREQRKVPDPRTILVNENVIIVEKDDGNGLKRTQEQEPEEQGQAGYPKRDTVKNYKRMFEPAETKQLNRWKPPVLRASAKSSSAKPSYVRPSAINHPKLNGDAGKKQTKPEQSVVFDFRGKNTKPNVTLQPTPFGCKPVQKSVKKFYRLFDGKEGLPNGWDEGDEDDDDDDDCADGGGRDLPHPCGVVFEGENVKVGRGSLLVNRNKNLRIHFNDDVTSVHEYPSELSLLENDRIESTNDTSQLGLTGLASYTPSVLKTGEAYQLGHPRITQTEKVPENEVNEVSEELKPADPELTTSWSSSATTDLLF
ncbi:uncharacterized protein [Centruroides vittatus]|uniref:uncharacterized protein n=1 Tax=Centruroides vittatus TaxID=120091 RepID=UPI0035106F73